MRKVIFVIGGLLLLNVIVLAFVSNYNAGFVIQGMISIALLTYAWFFKKISKWLHLTIGIVCLLPILLVAFLAIYGNHNNAIPNADVVIVLGAAIHGDVVSAPLASRLDKAIEYYDKNPSAKILVCGGQGLQENIPEAVAMANYLEAHGIPESSILEEEKSTSTYENFEFAKPILDEYFPNGATCVIITNDFHVYRAVQTAKRFGIYATHIGAPLQLIAMPMAYLREVAAVCKMWILPQH